MLDFVSAQSDNFADFERVQAVPARCGFVHVRDHIRQTTQTHFPLSIPLNWTEVLPMD